MLPLSIGMLGRGVKGDAGRGGRNPLNMD
jgi:hypothetical protein